MVIVDCTPCTYNQNSNEEDGFNVENQTRVVVTYCNNVVLYIMKYVLTIFFFYSFNKSLPSYTFINIKKQGI